MLSLVSIVNLLAIIVAPIIAVWVGQWLQKREEKRRDKLSVFKTLMIFRNGLSVESVHALNIIEVVFSDDSNVLKAWKEYYEKLCVDDPTENDLKKIETANYRLLEAVAVSLGYKDKITWESIQNPYKPRWMVEAEREQREYQNGQLKWAKRIDEIYNFMLLKMVAEGQDNRKRNN